MRRRMFLTMAFLLALMMPWSLSDAMAQTIDTADAQAIQNTVQTQLDALAEDDAVTAFDLSTSNIRVMLGTPDNFLRIIKENYPAVYRHRRALFYEPEIINGLTIQLVRLTDPDNSVWVAVYQMKQEADGSWKIDGCRLLETSTVSV
jgi:hypothetical protein